MAETLRRKAEYGKMMLGDFRAITHCRENALQ